MEAFNLRIRKATQADTDWILHHRIGLFRDSGSPDEFVSETAELTKVFLSKSWEDTFQYFLVEVNDEIVGGCGLSVLQIAPFSHNPQGKLSYLWNMYVEPEHRRKGYGKALVDHIIEVCREQGIGFVGLHATYLGRSVYESAGFRPFDSFLQFLPLKDTE
jgi:GNAT superfamily N-acetyltransferase